jgi:flagellar biosynthesis/type III secretory pathway protein FliH
MVTPDTSSFTYSHEEVHLLLEEARLDGHQEGYNEGYEEGSKKLMEGYRDGYEVQ